MGGINHRFPCSQVYHPGGPNLLWF